MVSGTAQTSVLRSTATPPAIFFSGTPVSGDTPLSVQFTDESTNNPTSWVWHFGDGETSFEQNPLHVYAEAGTYTVSLYAASQTGGNTAAISDYISVSAASTTWDPASKTAPVTLSNGNLTATTTDQVVEALMKGTVSHSTGKYALKFVCVFGAPASSEECGVGVVPATWDASTNTPSIADIGMYVGNDGFYIPAFIDLGLAITTGGYLVCAVNFDTGKIWFGNAGGYSGDPEAGTGEAITFTPNTALIPMGAGYSDGGGTVSVTLDPTYTSGTFAAWS